MTQQQIDAARLAEVQALELQHGGHASRQEGMCILEAVSYVAGEPWSDHPECACPVIATFLRSWNDALPDDERTDLLRDLIPRIVGTRSTPEVEQRRTTMAADWLIRTHTPAWLRLARLDAQADALAHLPEITDFATLQAVRRDAQATWDTAWAAARAASASTMRELQQSARALVIRMCEASP